MADNTWVAWHDIWLCFVLITCNTGMMFVQFKLCWWDTALTALQMVVG